MENIKGEKIKFYKKGKARQLRRTQTSCEKYLWDELRRKSIFGLKFRRQHPIGRYIVDFFCCGKKLIIELDGSVHEDEDRKTYDEKRQRELEFMGYRVIRFKDREILDNLDKTLKKIKKIISNDFKLI